MSEAPKARRGKPKSYRTVTKDGRVYRIAIVRKKKRKVAPNGNQG